jgi:hypothetical protein
MSSSERKKLLYLELNKYKELKEQIDALRDPQKELPRAPSAAKAPSLTNAPADARRAAKTESDTGDGESAPAADILPELVAAIKKLLTAEFAQLRKELRQMLGK